MLIIFLCSFGNLLNYTLTLLLFTMGPARRYTRGYSRYTQRDSRYTHRDSWYTLGIRIFSNAIQH